MVKLFDYARVHLCGSNSEISSVLRERDDVCATFLHSLRWNRPDLLLEVDVSPSGGRSFGWPSHRVQLPLDEAPGGSFDAGVGNRHHEFIELIGGQCRHVFLKTDRIPLRGLA